MSLSIDHQKNNIEWSGQDIKTIFAKKIFWKFKIFVCRFTDFNF